MKRVRFEDIEIGKRYIVKAGIWQLRNAMYVGLIPIIQCNGKYKYNPLFTCGDLDTWKENINIHTSKSNIKIYEGSALKR